MRTTTKRGLGRAATLNGNGHAVLPPAVLEPMRRYRQPPPPPRSRRRTAAQVFGWILLALLVVAGGLAGGLYLYVHESVAAVGAHSAGAKATAKDKHLHAVPAPTQPATALIIGYDTRKGSDAAAGQESRSDTIMLVRGDPTNDTLSIMSFPRDLTVPIYCGGSDAPFSHDRINSAWSSCRVGEQGVLDTVAHLTGIPINFVITVDFHGFKQIVNQLHGVYADIDHRYLNTVSGPGGYAKIDLQPGYQKLDGQQALDFVRFRHTDSDLYRLARQQLFLDALKDRLASSFHLSEIPGLIGAVKGNVEVAQAGGGAPSISVIQSYVGLGYHLPPGHLFRTSIPNLTECGLFNAEVCTSEADVQSAVQDFMHPDVTVSQRADQQALGLRVKTTRTKTLQPSEITALVLNGTTQAGLARDTSYKLAVAGFKTVHLPETVLADAPRQDYYTSYVYFDSVQPNAKQAAQILQQALGSNTKLAPLPPEIAPYAQQSGNPLTVAVVGTSFSGEVTNPAEHVQAPPAKQLPQVDTFDARPALQDVHVPFRVYTPSVIASHSQFTSMTPVRVFKPASHHKELVLTFVTGAGNVYYQVIETDWTDAPILRNPTGKHVDKKTGRKFALFTTSGNIHMIAFRKGKASYWVFNTLRDELSNETMLAIARGLRPLTK
ncbi:MAG TPA: LCP family protein [Gaiellaceae bacterium]